MVEGLALKEYMDFATLAAEKGGEVLRKYWGKLSNIRAKGESWNLVTEADQESEEVILEVIRHHYPSHHILSEEAGLHRKSIPSEFTWIVDPLDGTTNYTHQYPMVSISIALAVEEQPVVGVVYNPILGELFQAATGVGCFLNGERVAVSTVSSLGRSLLATGFAYDRKDTADNNYAEFCCITNTSQGVRRGGSAAIDLAYVAAGRLDGFWERGLSSWDIAAGVVLVQEAGGQATSYEGDSLDLSSGRILATNGVIHQELIAALKQAKKTLPPISPRHLH